MILEGDCLKQLKTLPDNSVDSIVTDPPYGLSFMGKKWDYDVPSVDIWREAIRVLKPGGHLLAFGGTRTYHRLVVNIEDAGFEIRDQLQWIYGQGFPKSLDISKAIDKQYGAEREVVGRYLPPQDDPKNRWSDDNDHFNKATPENGTEIFGGNKDRRDITAPATPEAKQWSGWGTALKPANEPIVLARKPLSEKSVAENVLKWGVGGLNIDGCRIGIDQTTRDEWAAKANKINRGTGNLICKNENVTDRFAKLQDSQGRFPANVLFDEAAAQILDEQSGPCKTGGPGITKENHNGHTLSGPASNRTRHTIGYSDSGGASRFFYVAKASRKERGEGNIHPTVKPVKLMEYLIRLVTPEHGIVLDPFMGSGTTGVAARNLDKQFIGIELNPEYVSIARQRLKATKSKKQRQMELPA